MLNPGLTGGKPLFRTDFEEIYTALAHMSLLITVQTNGSLMDDQVMALFDRYPPWEIKTTLYSASDEAYEKVCCLKSGLARVLEGIRRAQEAGIPLSVMAMAVCDNWQEMEQVYALVASLGIRLPHTNRILPRTRNPDAGGMDKMVRHTDLCENEREALCGRGEMRLRFTSNLQRCKV